MKTHFKTVHLKYKNYNSQHFGVASSKGTELQEHIVTKHLVKKYLEKLKRSESAKTFANKTMLEHHKNYIHLKVKPYKCESCPKCFTTELYLNFHMNNSGVNLIFLKCRQYPYIF